MHFRIGQTIADVGLVDVVKNDAIVENHRETLRRLLVVLMDLRQSRKIVEAVINRMIVGQLVERLTRKELAGTTR